jgi:hypothetical protein
MRPSANYVCKKFVSCILLIQTQEPTFGADLWVLLASPTNIRLGFKWLSMKNTRCWWWWWWRHQKFYNIGPLSVSLEVRLKMRFNKLSRSVNTCRYHVKLISYLFQGKLSTKFIPYVFDQFLYFINLGHFIRWRWWKVKLLVSQLPIPD